MSEAGGSSEPAPAVVLFDGTCNLCNASVRFILARDPHARFRFAPLDSKLGRSLGVDSSGDASSMLLLEGGTVYDRSTAALRIARKLRAPWPLLWVFIVVPRPIRDAVYGFIARNRHRWFGRSETCPVPTPEQAARFLRDE